MSDISVIGDTHTDMTPGLRVCTFTYLHRCTYMCKCTWYIYIDTHMFVCVFVYLNEHMVVHVACRSPACFYVWLFVCLVACTLACLFCLLACFVAICAWLLTV